MKITKKVVRIAQSLGIIIDKPILEKMKIKEGDYVEIDIKKYVCYFLVKYIQLLPYLSFYIKSVKLLDFQLYFLSSREYLFFFRRTVYFYSSSDEPTHHAF